MRCHVDGPVQKPISLLGHPLKLFVSGQVLAQIEVLQVVKIKRLGIWTSSDAQTLVDNVSWVDQAYSVAEKHETRLIGLSMLHLRIYTELVKRFVSQDLVISEQFYQ